MKKISSIFTLVLIILTAWGTGWAATYYMRADGSHAAVTSPEAHAGGPCSTASECLSIATHNDSTFSAGDTIYLCDDGGEYRGDGVNAWEFLRPPSSGSAGGGYITYQNASGDTPIINGSVVVAVGSWTAAGSDWYWDPPDIGESSSEIEPMQVWCDDVRLTYTDPIAGNGQWRWNAASTRIEIRPTDGTLDTETIEVSQSARGIHATNKQYIIIDGITVKKIAARGDFNSNPFDDSNGDFLAYSLYFGNFGGTCDHIIVRNCTVSQGGGRTDYDGSGGTTTDWSSGIELYNCDASQVYNNSVSDFHTCAYDIECPSITETTGYTFYNNTASSIRGTCLWIPNSGGSFYNNTFTDCATNTWATATSLNRAVYTGGTSDVAVAIYNNMVDGCGADCIRSAGNQTSNLSIYYNIVRDWTRSGIAITNNSDDVDVFNNTLYDTDGGSAPGAAIWIQADKNDDVVVRNNIMYVDSNYCVYAPTADADSPTINHNVYYRVSSGNAFVWDNGAGDLTYTYAQFGDWQTASSQDANSIANDPLFVNATGKEFDLRIGSPAIDKGDDLDLTPDFGGRTVPNDRSDVTNADNGTDIGALEFYNRRDHDGRYVPRDIPSAINIGDATDIGAYEFRKELQIDGQPIGM